MNRDPRTWSLLLLGAVLASAPALARQDAPPDDPPAPEKKEAPKPPPSLDELLGLEKETDAETERTAEQLAEEAARAELQRRLDEEAIGSAFAEALSKMAIAADQLDQRFDTGLGTQRVQEEILAKLAFLLDEAKKQQSSGSASSSSTSRSEGQQPAQSPGKQQASGSQQPSPDRSGDSRPGDPPPLQQGDVNSILEEERTEWGSLPERVRDMLLQGRREKFSSLYEQLTREYYRRLAEEGSQ